MSVQVSPDGVILMSGRCENEDAETLLQALLATPASPVDWTRCEYAHSAVIQVLLVAKPLMRGQPNSEILHRWIYPLVARRAL